MPRKRRTSAYAKPDVPSPVVQERTNSSRRRKGATSGTEASSKSPKGRDKLMKGNRYWMYGRHAVNGALCNPEREIHYLQSHYAPEELYELLPDVLWDNLQQQSIQRSDKSDIDALLPPNTPSQGIAALVSPLPAAAIEDYLDPAETPLILALDQVTDPHNVGAILRSCAAFGVSAVLVQDRHCPPETGSLAKSASGAVDQVPLIRVANLNRGLTQFKEAGYWIVGLDAHGQAFNNPNKKGDQTKEGDKLFSLPLVVVMGSEGDGMRRLIRESCDYLVRLPMHPQMESLNVSNAAAITLYEISRHAPTLLKETD